jgi:hypothetical protein
MLDSSPFGSNIAAVTSEADPVRRPQELTIARIGRTVDENNIDKQH